MNFELKVALLRRFGTQVSAAKKLGFLENKLSYIVRGHLEPTPKDVARFEAEFGQTLTRRLLRQSGKRAEQAPVGAAVVPSGS